MAKCYPEVNMLVKRAEITEVERLAFEQVVRSCGRRPDEFRLEAFTACTVSTLRSVHVATSGGAAQYEASEGRAWTLKFAEHLARGCFPPNSRVRPPCGNVPAAGQPMGRARRRAG
jgi:hypothetical protein